MKKKYYEEEDRELMVKKVPNKNKYVIKDRSFVKDGHPTHTTTTYNRRQVFDLIKMLFQELEIPRAIKLTWNHNDLENAIDINFDDQKIGTLNFKDKRDIVRFALNVAKHNGLTPHEFAKLSNEVMGQEMKDWK